MTATQVVAYLKRHPDFFAEHPEILDALTPPAARSGPGVVDMQQFMLKRQRDDISKLKGQQKLLIGTTRANLASQTRVHSAVLTLLAANSFEQLIQIVTTDLAMLLDSDVVTIGVESNGETKPRFPACRFSRPGPSIASSGRSAMSRSLPIRPVTRRCSAAAPISCVRRRCCGSP